MPAANQFIPLGIRILKTIRCTSFCGVKANQTRKKRLLLMIRDYSWLLLLMAIAIMTAADDDSRSAGRNGT